MARDLSRSWITCVIMTINDMSTIWGKFIDFFKLLQINSWHWNEDLLVSSTGTSKPTPRFDSTALSFQSDFLINNELCNIGIAFMWCLSVDRIRFDLNYQGYIRWKNCQQWAAFLFVNKNEYNFLVREKFFSFLVCNAGYKANWVMILYGQIANHLYGSFPTLIFTIKTEPLDRLGSKFFLLFPSGLPTLPEKMSFLSCPDSELLFLQIGKSHKVVSLGEEKSTFLGNAKFYFYFLSHTLLENTSAFPYIDLVSPTHEL